MPAFERAFLRQLKRAFWQLFVVVLDIVPISTGGVR
jgi:hypothetical protein